MASTQQNNLYVTYVDFDRDLLKVWGQRNRISGTYVERLLLQLLPEFNKTVSPNPSRIHKGMFCFAKYTDDNYYRARVISRVQGDSVCVLFVDYGNRDTIKLSNIRIHEGNEGDVLSKMSEQAEEYYLARVAAPPLGWTRDMLSEIRRDICYDEFCYQIVDQVGDQKILEVQFRNEDFSNYLVKKQLARPLPLPVQREMILSYCSLVSNDVKRDDSFRDPAPRLPFSPSLPPPALRAPLRHASLPGEVNMQLNYAKANSPVNFSCPPPSVHYPPPRHLRSPFHHVEPNIPKNSYYHQVGHHVPVDPVPAQAVNAGLNPALNHQMPQFFQVQSNVDSGMNNAINNNNNIHTNHNNNNNLIEILAQQVKQFIAKDNAKSESNKEKAPHHYVNSVLEVGNTYNVIISYIDDGPWSFSIQLLSSEIELQKLMDELSTVELVPIKPPIIVGHPCIASSAMYGNLCRGVIVSISRSAVKVYFVDFGNTEDLPASAIYELPPKFFKTRVLSQKFSLSGLQKVAYSDDIKKFFKEVVQDGLLVLRVTSLEDDNLPTCELYLKERNIKRILNEKMRELRNSVLEDFPKVGDTENVLVTWVVSPQKFFVQLCKRDADLNALKQELEEVGSKGQTLTYQQLSVGSRCVCKYEPDGHWYRAVITSVDSENAISVFYIDYGNTDTVSISRLRKVDGGGLINQMSYQAFQCSLKGFENRHFNEELAKKFEALTLENEFQMSVASSDKQLLCVNLLHNGNDIATLLLLMQQTEEKKRETEANGHSSGNIWSSSESTHSITRNMSEKENASPRKEESFEQRDRNFRGDQNRFEERGNRRDNKISRENDNEWAEPKSWRSRGPREFGEWDSSKTAASRDPPRARDDSYNAYNNRRGGTTTREGREFGQGRNGHGRDGRRTTSNYRSGESRGPRFDGDGREGKRFDSNRRWDSFKGGDESKRKFGDRVERSDEKKSSRVPIRKDDIAPPGSKFEERNIEIGSSERGIVTYYFSPDEFFVQLLTQEDEFKKMMKDIQHYYSDKYSIRDPVKAGDIVIAQFSHDKILYRAEVIKPTPVTVRYIDYGNQEPVQPKGIWYVDSQFLKLPQQVVKCRLSGLQPTGSDWPPPGSPVDKFFEFAEYKCTFLGKEGDMYEISMETPENGKDVASEIIGAGLGRSVGSELDIPEIDFSLLPNQILRLFVPHVESSSKFYVLINPKAPDLIADSISAIGDAKRVFSPFDWSKFEPEMPCAVTIDDVSWYRGNVIKTEGDKVSVRLSDRGDTFDVTKDKVMQLPDYLRAIRPQAVECCLHGIPAVENEENFTETVEGRSHLIHILSVTDKGLSVIFYDEEGELYDFETDCDAVSRQKVEPVGQLPITTQRLPLVVSHLQSLNEIYIQRVPDEADLINFLDQVNCFYAEEGEDWGEDEEIPAGTFVAAKSKVFDSWYRARVISSAGGNAEVVHIDFGNRETLPRENLKKLDSSFLSQNAFSRAVALEGDFPVKNAEEVQKKFWEVCDEKNLVGYFKNNNGELMIEIRANEESLADRLKLVLSDTESTVEVAPPEPAKDLKVFVSHIDSPSCFWVHKEEIVADLQRFQDKLLKDCPNVPNKTDAKMGDLVAVAFSGMWYRARVTGINEDTLKVQFIDYGNTAIVDLNLEAVKNLPPDSVDVPVFATRFALKGLWNGNGTSKFAEIILRNEDPLTLRVLEDTDPVVVDLFQDGRSITEMLEEELASQAEDRYGHLDIVYITHSLSPDDFYIQKEASTEALKEVIERLANASNFENPGSIKRNQLYAARHPEDGAWYRARVIDVGEETTVQFVDYGNTSAVTEVKCLPRDLLDLPKLSENCSLVYGNSCDSWSEAACELFAEYADGRPLRMNVVATKGSRTLVRLFHENRDLSEEMGILCENDKREEMYVSHAVSPTEFYVQFVDDEKYRIIEETLKSDVRSEELEDRGVGALCQACFMEDGCWYRARILQDLGEKGCEVFFIDFGNVSIAKELKKLPPELEDIPPRAVKCSLDLPSTDVPKSVTEEFITLTAGGTTVFRGRIVCTGDPQLISLKLDGRILEETFDVSLEESMTNGYQNGEEESEAELPVSCEELEMPAQTGTMPKTVVLGSTPKPPYQKLKYSEKVVPGSISRGVSLESMTEEHRREARVEDRGGKKEEEDCGSYSVPNAPDFRTGASA